ncbi:gamma-glutamylcyclotransferase family protein [Jatrophihabitans sp. YIM 134969]
MTAFVFGYGSLAVPVPGGFAARLAGARRAWTVAMDNTVDLPAYKHHLDVEGSRPDVCVAYLDLLDDEGSAVDGVCRPVDDSTLASLDLRERQYERIDVTARVTPSRGPTWAYIGRAESRERAAAARRAGRLVVSRAYLDAVPSGTTTDLPVLDLVRVDTP